MFSREDAPCRIRTTTQQDAVASYPVIPKLTATGYRRKAIETYGLIERAVDRKRDIPPEKDEELPKEECFWGIWIVEFDR